MRAFLFLFGGLFLLSASAGIGAGDTLRRVAVSVADLRKEPVPAQSVPGHDPLQESQLLYGELVEIFEENQDWTRISAIEQPEWTHNLRWEGYPGWVQKSSLVPAPDGWEPDLRVTAKLVKVRMAPDEKARSRYELSIGSKLVGSREGDWWRLNLLDGSIGWIRHEEAQKLEEPMDRALLREKVVKTAELFLGDPYYWGGRSAHNPNVKLPQTSVDCSGLVSLAYRANGLDIPRDAHEQWMKARPLARHQLQPGDLVFLSDPKDPEWVVHVMLYIGEDRAIEGPGTGRKVRTVNLQKRLQETQGRRVYYGTYDAH